MMISAALMSLCLLGQAEAGPYMWGVGPTVGTRLFPVRYPNSQANALDSLAWDYTGARADVSLGAHGVLFLDDDSRLGAKGVLGFGGGYFNRWVDVEYDRILTSDSGFHLFVGLGLGVGMQTFTDSANTQLEVNHFTTRTQFGGVYRDKVRAYELNLFAQYYIPLEHRYIPSGEAEQVIEGRGARYPGIGVEASVYFGDFTPPKKKGKGKGKGKGR